MPDETTQTTLIPTLKKDVTKLILLTGMYILIVQLIGGIAVLVGSMEQIVAGVMAGMEEAGASAESAQGAMNVDAQTITDALSPQAIALGSIVGVAVGVGVLALIFKRRFFAPLTRPLAPGVRFGLLSFLIVFCVILAVQFASQWIGIAIDALLKPTGYSFTGSYTSLITGLETPLGVVYAVAVGPVAEELVFRGFIQGNLEKYGRNFAIVFSSLCFGLMHMILFQVMFAFIIGLVLGFVASRWSLRASIILHIANNALAMSANMLGFSDASLMILFGACFVVSVVLALRYRPLVRAGLAEGRADGAVSRAGLLHPLFLVYAAVLILLGVFMTSVV